MAGRLGFGTLDVKGGWFHSRQNVQQRWAISERVMEASRNGALIDLYDNAGAALTSAGVQSVGLRTDPPSAKAQH